MGGAKQLYEVCYLLVKITQYLCLAFIDYLEKFFYPKNPLGKPLHWYLTAKNLSSILGQEVQTVEVNPKHGHRLNDAEILAGLGSGTSFCWLQITLKNNSILNLFLKTSTNDFFKSLFLTIFGVYSNELNFYQQIISLNCLPKDLYPQVYYSKMIRTQFLLILDDILAKNVSFPTILENCSKERAELVIRSLARVHAMNWGHPPESIWNDRNRPLFCSVIALETLQKIQKRYQPNPLLSVKMECAYRKYIENYETIRRRWSREVLTLVHGDTHIGNMHFYPSSSSASPSGDQELQMGFHDWQCVAQEHGMRDVGYFLLSSLDSDALEANDCELEKKLLENYLTELNSQLTQTNSSCALLTYPEVWRLYQELSWWTLTAFLISAGAGDLMPDPMIRTSLQRITRGMVRIGAIESLDTQITG
jgi:thiamine kinase-like enzyme